MKTRVVGLGAGGHARVMIDALHSDVTCEIVGLLDPNTELHGTTVESVPVLGSDEALDLLLKDGVTHFFVGLGGVEDLRPRTRLYEMAMLKGFVPYPVVHPSAIIARSAVVKAGITAMAGVIVHPGVRIGENAILNTGSLIEHDCMIGDHAHIGPGACLLGAVSVGSQSFVGGRAVIRQGVRIGDRAVIGMGAVVLTDVEDGRTVVGNPARMSP